MNPLVSIIIASVVLALISLCGVIVLYVSKKSFHLVVPYLVALSAGSLIAGAIFHLIPEAVEIFENSLSLYLYIALGLISFYILEQYIHWHHCHRGVEEHKAPFTYLILVADTIHNLIDGAAVGAAFVESQVLGFSTTFAIALHEIPQELGDFGILIHGGWEKNKALLVNFLSSLSFLVGAMAVYIFSKSFNISFMLPFAAGNFLYIGAVDLIPEIKNNCTTRERFGYFFAFILGMAIILAMRLMHSE